jgi:hypothetical protein
MPPSARSSKVAGIIYSIRKSGVPLAALAAFAAAALAAAGDDDDDEPRRVISLADVLRDLKRTLGIEEPSRARG